MTASIADQSLLKITDASPIVKGNESRNIT